MDLAPIALFVYNRPWHTLQTVEALAKNDLAKESTLYVFADGAKEGATEKELEKIREVAAIINQERWCGHVIFVRRETNLGLADNIVGGVTQIVNQYGKIIVLEDDIVTSTGFLRFMNDALKAYELQEKVMHISGYMFPVLQNLPSTFFYNTASCWGWATWSRAWKNFDDNPRSLLATLRKKKLLDKFNIENSYSFSDQLMMNIKGIRRTWAVKWYASFFLQGGYSLHPYPSLVNNIGHDGQGENCQVSSVFDWPELAKEIQVSEIDIIESDVARSAMRLFNSRIKSRPKKNSLINLLRKIVPNIALKLYRKITNESYRKKIEVDREVERLKRMPRFQPGSTSIFGKPIKFTDSASFLFIYQELFKYEIYKFQTDKPCPYIVDAGANIGLSIIYFKKEYPTAEIVAFEPDLKVFNTLKDNITSLGHKDVILISKALWNEATTLDFLSEGADAGRLYSERETKGSVKVSTTSLRPYLVGKKVDLLKIDIEGAETVVLQDCADLLSNVDKIFVEYHSFVNREQSLDVLLKILKDAGFRCYISHIGVASSHPLIQIRNYMGMDNQLNIFGTKM